MLLGSGAAIALAACANPPTPPLVLTVKNASDERIEAIYMKPCGADDLAFQELPGTRLKPDHRVEVELPPHCIDLVAYEERGRLVGEQRGLRMLPGSSWIIR